MKPIDRQNIILTVMIMILLALCFLPDPRENERGKLVIIIDVNKMRVSSIQNNSTLMVHQLKAEGNFVFPRDDFKYEISFRARPTSKTPERIYLGLDAALQSESQTNLFPKPHSILPTDQK